MGLEGASSIEISVGGVSSLSSTSPFISDGCVRTRVRARSAFRLLHLLLGLSVGLLLVIQGLTGAALVWRPELDRLLLQKVARTGNQGQRGSLDAESAAVKAAIPEGRVRLVRLTALADGADEWNLSLPVANPQGNDRGGLVGGELRRTVYVVPATAQILGIRGEKRDMLSFLVELHHSLFLGQIGRVVLGYLAIATILLALSGLWLWWPARWAASRFRPRASARPLHYALGFWAMWPLLAIATTALYFTWRQPIQKVFGVDEPRRAMPEHAGHDADRIGHRDGQNKRVHGPRTETATALDAILASVRTAAPEEEIVGLRFPERPGGVFTVLCARRGQHYRAAPDAIAVRIQPDGTPHVANVLLWEQLPPAKRLLEWLPRVHQAEIGGVPVRLLWSVTGCMPAVLYVSGFLMWRRRVRAEKSFPQ